VLAKFDLAEPELRKPFEKLLARGPREGPAEDWLFVPGCLADQEHAREHRLAYHGRTGHLVALVALAQRALMRVH
jgi:hypothetical protein